MAKQKLLYGIDLGTTNSCISVYQAGVSKAIPLDNSGETTLPSCVMWEGGDKFVVGKEAYSKRGASNVTYSSKRLMGSSESITLVNNGETREFKPEEIAAEVLKELVKRASRLHKNVTDVVVCVPAYFNNNQIAATKEAIKLAGLRCIQIAKEPTAAALVYNSVGVLSKERVLIYDLGGGTFDVSLVQIEPPIKSDTFSAYGITGVNKTMFHVLGVDGDTHLGGDDVDDLLVKKILAKLPSKYKNLLSTAETEELKLFCERSKKLMSLEASYSILRGNTVIKLTLTSKEIIEAIDEVFDRTLVPIKRLLEQNGGVESVTQLITVGGSTMSKRLRERLENELPNLKKNYSLNPDESVAIGAAIQAAVLHSAEDLTVVDCLAGNYGISMSDGAFNPILKNGSPIPISESCVVSTISEEQKSLDVHFFQGMSPFAAECTHIGGVHVDGIIAGLVRIDMAVDSDGLLVVRANDSTGVGETKQLINILGRENHVGVVVDKKVVRWKAVAKKNLDNKLLKLIEQYETTREVSLEKKIIIALKKYSGLKQSKRVSMPIGVDEEE